MIRHPIFPGLGKPFRFVPKRLSRLSSKLNGLLNAFESSLADRLENLKPGDTSGFMDLSWIQHAMQVLFATHKDLQALVTDLPYPVTEWDEKWMDEYLDDTLKLLDVCIAVNAEISENEQDQLLVQYVLHVLESSGGISSADKIFRARDSLGDLMKERETKRKNSVSLRKMENCSAIFQALGKSLKLRKMKCSAKGKILLRAMYGVKATTIFVCSVLASALSGSTGPLVDLQVPDVFSWSGSFMSLQQTVNEEIRSRLSNGPATVLKEFDILDASAKNLQSVIETMPLDAHGDMKEEAERIEKAVKELRHGAELLAQGIDPLAKLINDFFQIVLNGRTALLDSLRLSENPEITNGDDFYRNKSAKLIF